MPVHSVPNQSNNLLITQEPCCQVYVRDCSQAADKAALDSIAMDFSAKRLRKGAKVWNEASEEVVRAVAFCIIRQQLLVGPALSPQRGFSVCKVLLLFVTVSL